MNFIFLKINQYFSQKISAAMKLKVELNIPIKRQNNNNNESINLMN